MPDIAVIISSTVKEIERSGLPKQSINTDAFFLLLLKAARAEIQRLRRGQGEGLEKNELKYLAKSILELRNKSFRIDGEPKPKPKPLPFVIKKDRKAMSQEMFEKAQKLGRGDVSTWIRWCRHVEQHHRDEIGGNLPRAYTQIKSNIKRMLQAGMDLQRYKCESDARAALLNK